MTLPTLAYGSTPTRRCEAAHLRSDEPPRILVVDDEPAVRAPIACAVQEAGYEVVAVKDGKAGRLSLTKSPLLGHQLAHLLKELIRCEGRPQGGHVIKQPVRIGHWLADMQDR